MAVAMNEPAVKALIAEALVVFEAKLTGAFEAKLEATRLFTPFTPERKQVLLFPACLSFLPQNLFSSQPPHQINQTLPPPPHTNRLQACFDRSGNTTDEDGCSTCDAVDLQVCTCDATVLRRSVRVHSLRPSLGDLDVTTRV